MGSIWGTPGRVTVEREDDKGSLKVVESRNNRPTSDPVQFNQNRRGGSDEDLDRLKEVYQNRIRELEQKNTEFYLSSIIELNRIVASVEEKYLKSSTNTVCGELRDTALRCYLNNQKFSLNCSADIRAFVNCVQSHREKMMLK